MGKTAILAIKIISDAKDAVTGMDKAAESTSKFEGNLKKAGVASGVVLAGMVALAKKAGDAASELEQAGGAVDSVFGSAAGSVHDLAAGAAKAVGLSKTEYSNLAAVLGAQLGNLGISQDKIVSTTADLITKGADLAATFGGPTSDAVSALAALFRGEADPIERYGVSIKQNDVNARLAAMGMDKLTGAALTQANTQTRLAMLTEQTTGATGQFSREVGSAAGSQQIANAMWENAIADLGMGLLPLMVIGAQLMQAFAGFVGDNTEVAQAMAVAVAFLAVGILAMNFAMAASPLTWMLVAAAAVVGIIVLLATAFAKMGDETTEVGKKFAPLIGFFKEAWEWAGRLMGALGSFLGLSNQARSVDLGGGESRMAEAPAMAMFAAPAPALDAPAMFSARAQTMALDAPSLALAGRAATTGPPVVQQITEVTVKVDPFADAGNVAKTIKNMLDARDRANGRTVSTGVGRL